MAVYSPSSARGAARCSRLPRIIDNNHLYSATALHSARPLTSLQVELLHACIYPIHLQALAAQIGLSAVTVAWLLQAMAQHGLIREAGAV